tara:strand:- start:119 stop:547 length:429 start_codon:yes stop_codon:yes gene_type:complete
MSILGELTTPSRFTGDWLGYAGNQGTHVLIGMLSIGIMCAFTFLTVGDLPHKESMFLGVFVVYVVKELFGDGWNGFDTIADIQYLVGYGAGGTLLTFSQINDFSSDVNFNENNFLVVFTVFCIHLSIGIFTRIREAKNARSD